MLAWPRIKGEPVAFKPNYNQQRAERDRLKRAKKAEKLSQLQERTAQRKAEQEKAADGGRSEDPDEEN
jgi:hypothetical protein